MVRPSSNQAFPSASRVAVLTPSQGGHAEQQRCNGDSDWQVDAAGKRGYSAMEQAFHNTDLMLRIAGDTLALTPPLIISEDQIGEIVDKVGKVIKAVA